MAGMLRRLSTKFGKDKKDEANGRTNGHADGISNGKAPSNRRQSSLLGNSKKQSEPDVDHSVGRQEVETSFSKYAALIHASRRPLPNQTGDGQYLEQHEAGSLWGDLRTLGFKDVKTLMGVMQNKATGELQDDKTYLMERVIQLVADLPSSSKTRVDLTNAFIDELWHSLQHPPLNYLGPKHIYRSADGSNNNPFFPKLGAANTPYARSVLPETIQPAALPDPGAIFDAVMAREVFKPHPNRVSSVFFYWASLIIHDLFQTDHRDFNNSQTSSYLDLSTLYGDVEEDQKEIRTYRDGKLKPDCFSEKRLLGFPPGCGVLLIMLNRFHNHVVEQLAIINENGRFNKPEEGMTHETRGPSWEKYDEDLFQTGRLITCGLYINITLMDYLRTIVNLNRSNTTWTLDPRAEMKGKNATPAGTGNQVSAEFALAYRWHSCISDKDDKWTQQLYRELFGKEAADVSLPELLQGLGKWEHALDKDPAKRPFNHMKRGPDGKFDDDELANIMKEAIEDVSGSFGANNIPKCLRAVTILGMQQARKWNLASLNEFRRFFHLKGYDTFEDLNPDPHAAEQLKHLYEHPEFVELYPGLVSEAPKVPMVPGVGIAPTFTISRAVLSDAVALVRGDRFYTIDYNPKNLTNWGYQEAAYDLNVNQGCLIYRLFLRALPNHFKHNSIYAHYPMTVPDENIQIMKSLGREQDYDWDPPAPMSPKVNLMTYTGAKYVLERPDSFKPGCGKATTWLFGQEGALLGNTPLHARQRDVMRKAFYHESWRQEIKDFYEFITIKLLHQHSCKIAGVNQVDITRDVGNLAHVHFASSAFSLPLKTEDHPKGIYSEQELYMVMAVIHVAAFLDMDPSKSFPLQHATRAISKQLGALVEANVRATNLTGWISGVVDGFYEENSPLKSYGVHMVRRLLESGLNVSETTWAQIVPTAVAMVAKPAEEFTQVLDYYLSQEGKPYLSEINRLAKMNTAEADDKILHYAMEGIRLNGTSGSYQEVANDCTISDGGRDVNVKAGDKVFCSFAGAAKEEKVFPKPNEVDLNRPLNAYIHHEVGSHACLGQDAPRVALTAMLKTVGKLDNLRRAAGPQGQLRKIQKPDGSRVYLKSNWESYFPFPTTMKINWDGELPPLKA